MIFGSSSNTVSPGPICTTWAKYPAAPEQVDEWRRALPLALEGLYYPGMAIVSPTGALFAAAGLPDAEEYRRFRRQSLEELRAHPAPAGERGEQV
ncbi:MAG: hypothetical protein R3C43_19745 [Chloroflexota bacterium]